MERYLAIKKKVLKNIMLSKRIGYKRPHIAWFHLSEVSRAGKSIDKKQISESLVFGVL